MLVEKLITQVQWWIARAYWLHAQAHGVLPCSGGFTKAHRVGELTAHFMDRKCCARNMVAPSDAMVDACEASKLWTPEQLAELQLPAV